MSSWEGTLCGCDAVVRAHVPHVCSMLAMPSCTLANGIRDTIADAQGVEVGGSDPQCVCRSQLWGETL